jgi:hypothetical protein
VPWKRTGQRVRTSLWWLGAMHRGRSIRAAETAAHRLCVVSSATRHNAEESPTLCIPERVA